MKILCTDLFEEQLKDILETFVQEDFDATKKFKMYLETIIINIPTKMQKYKQSIYFEDENVKEVEHQGFRIPFYIDAQTNNIIILAIVKK